MVAGGRAVALVVEEPEVWVEAGAVSDSIPRLPRQLQETYPITVGQGGNGSTLIMTTLELLVAYTNWKFGGKLPRVVDTVTIIIVQVLLMVDLAGDLVTHVGHGSGNAGGTPDNDVASPSSRGIIVAVDGGGGAGENGQPTNLVETDFNSLVILHGPLIGQPSLNPYNGYFMRWWRWFRKGWRSMAAPGGNGMALAHGQSSESTSSNGTPVAVELIC